MGTLTSCKYLGVVVSDYGSKAEVFPTRTTHVSSALTNLKPIQSETNMSLGSKIKWMRSLVIYIFLYACEIWNLLTDAGLCDEMLPRSTEHIRTI